MKKPTKQQQLVLDKLCAGHKLYVSHEDGESHYLLDMEERLDRRVIQNLLNQGALIEAADAMFGIGQTLVPAEAQS